MPDRDSEHENQNDHTLEGWRRDTSLRIYQLSPERLPAEWRDGVQSEAEARLAASPIVAEIVGEIQRKWTGIDGFLDQLRSVILRADQQARILNDMTLLDRVQEAFDVIAAEFLGAAAVIHSSVDVPYELIVDYLARRILSADIAPFFLPKSSPVQVIANAERTTGVMVYLYPGEFVVKGHGVGRKEIAKHVGGFITEAQRIIDREYGREPKRPGRKSNMSDEDRALAHRVRELKLGTEMTAVAICDDLGISYCNADDARSLVRKWLAKAEKLDKE